MAIFRVPSEWRELDRRATAADFEPLPTAGALRQAHWRLRHPDEDRRRQKVKRWRACRPESRR
jgi:hypothetical protein